MEFTTKYELFGSFLMFTKVFYKLRTGREFKLTTPISRESHYITISKALSRTVYPTPDHRYRGQKDDMINRLLIACPPRYGKTELLIHYVAWCMAQYPDSAFLYVSYSHSLAKKQTQTVRQIMQLPYYRELFGVELTKESSAKDNFETTAGGSVYAAGAGGTIVGRGAGIQNCDRFGGAIVIDDIHKPAEVTSDTMRNEVKDWYLNTLQSRVNSPTTPVIFIGQRLHEDDLAANLLKGHDGHKWHQIVLEALGSNGMPLHPEMHNIEQLRKMQEVMPYEFAAQYQQNPQPAGGGIFKPEWFMLLPDEPDIYCTFITVDTAETSKTYNDATVFSFWGLYKIMDRQIQTDIVGLHWIDCHQCWVEPKDLEHEFMEFYAKCMAYKSQPQFAAIEKKSTGTTLVSMLQDLRGINIREIERTRASGNKTQRFLEIQPYIAQKRVSLPAYGVHTPDCIEHMRKITVNDTHRYDDIADTCADALRLCFIDKSIGDTYTSTNSDDKVAAHFAQHYTRVKKARAHAWHVR